jgi:hypothetical protein
MGGGGDFCVPIFGSNEPNFSNAESLTVEDVNSLRHIPEELILQDCRRKHLKSRV